MSKHGKGFDVWMADFKKTEEYKDDSFHWYDLAKAAYLAGVDDGVNGLRDQFASKAISPLLTDAALPTKEDRDEWLPKIAEIAYEMADAMMLAREN